MKNSILLVFLLAFCSVVMGQKNSLDTEKNEFFTEGSREAKQRQLKQNLVKLYSTKDKGTVVIRSHRNFDVHLYIFDLENTIMYQGVLEARKKTRITMEKGTYTYIIFRNEESIEEGKLVIK